MKQGFLINRGESWEINGKYNGFILKSDKLINNGGVATYTSFSLDSNESDMTWQRMKIIAEITKKTKMNMSIYSSNILTPPQAAIKYFTEIGGLRGEEKNLDQMLDELTPEQGYKLIKTAGSEIHEDTLDILLYQFKGRYMWFSITLYSYENSSVLIEQVSIEFPKIAFTSYLPQIYNGEADDFMSRFVAIFQSFYLDLETEISVMPRLYQTHIADKKFLNWIASWFGIHNQYIWEEDKLRILLENIVNLYKYKGTISSIKKIVSLLIDVEPLIIERFNITITEFYQNDKDMMDNLFGDNDYVFTLMVLSKDINTVTRFLELLKTVKWFTPIEMICNPVVLEENIYLNYHCYLGVNTVLYEKQDIVLDESHLF